MDERHMDERHMDGTWTSGTPRIARAVGGRLQGVGSGVPYVVPEIGYGAAGPEVVGAHRGTRDVPGRHPRPAPELPARHPGPAPGVPARHPGPAPEVPARHPRCRHHTERKLADRVDSPSRAQIAPPRWLHTPVGVPWR